MYFYCQVLHNFVCNDDTYVLRKSTTGNCDEIVDFLSPIPICYMFTHLTHCMYAVPQWTHRAKQN